MNKFSYLLLGGFLLGLTGCSQEDLLTTGNNGISKVTFTIDMPGIATRSYSNGMGSTKLQYGVYEIMDDDPTNPTINLVEGLSNDNDVINMRKSLTLDFVTNHKYRVVFWASNENSPYSISWGKDSNPVMTVNYGSIKANDETLDGFFKTIDLDVNGDVQMDVELKRPFAQINIGASDYNDSKLAGCDPEVSSITVTTKYNTLDLVTGKATKDTQDNPSITFDFNTIAGHSDVAEETFPVDGHDYLAMAYVLVNLEDDDPDNSDRTKNELVDVTFKYNDKAEDQGYHTRQVGSVPIKRNYRTNIYGEILTSNANLNVMIEPNYDDNNKGLEANAFTQILDLGGTLVMEEDLELNKVKNVYKDVIIDLNGHKLSLTGQALRVWSGANLVIKGEGEVEVDGAMAAWAVNGTITIEGGTFTGTSVGEMFYIGNGNPLYGGTVYIKGGVFKPAPNSGILNCQDDAYRAGIAKFIVTGGTFYGGFNPAESMVEPGAPVNWLPNGYVSQKTEIDGEECYVVLKEGTTIVDSKNFATEIKNGGDFFLIEDVAVNSLSYNSSANVDLNGNTITSHQNGASGYKSDVTYSNGKIVFDQAKATNPMLLVAEANATLTLENMELELMNGCLSVEGENSELRMINCKAKGNNQIISTNASNATNSTPKVKMYLENCEFSASTPILNNVPAVITMVNCTLDGGIQGALIRGGEATFIDCTINFHNNMDYSGSHNPFRSKWGQGNMCVMAAIAGGNLNTPSAYQYPTVINLEGNNVINISGNYADETPAIHLAANSGEGLGVSFNYNTTNLKINYPEGVTLKSNYKEIEYSTSNIKVNGSVVSPNVTL